METTKAFIYILTNPSFPEWVKIGYAHDAKERVKQLNRSEAVPFAFRLYATYEVHKEFSDKELHRIIDSLNKDLRSTENIDGKNRVREFYQMSAEDAYQLLKCIANISGTTDRLKLYKQTKQEAEDEKQAEEVREKVRLKSFDFVENGIPVGSELEYVDDPNIKVKVLNNRQIEYNGQETSVSKLAQQLKGFSHSVQGTLWFTYKGKKLVDIRKDNLGE